MDFSDSMFSIAKQCFPNATIVIDCSHIVQRFCEGLEEMRLRFIRLATIETKKKESAFAQNEDRKARQIFLRLLPTYPLRQSTRKGRFPHFSLLAVAILSAICFLSAAVLLFWPLTEIFFHDLLYVKKYQYIGDIQEALTASSDCISEFRQLGSLFSYKSSCHFWII